MKTVLLYFSIVSFYSTKRGCASYIKDPPPYPMCSQPPNDNKFSYTQVWGRYWATSNSFAPFNPKICEDAGLETPWIKTEDDFIGFFQAASMYYSIFKLGTFSLYLKMYSFREPAIFQCMVTCRIQI